MFIVRNFNINHPIIATIPFIVLGSLLPDIDNRYSIIGRYFAPFNTLMTHRGITHTFIGLLFFTLPVFIFGSNVNTISFIYGYVSHLLLDMLTPAGIKIAYPLNENKYSLNLCRTGGFIELALFCLSLQYIFLK